MVGSYLGLQPKESQSGAADLLGLRPYAVLHRLHRSLVAFATSCALTLRFPFMPVLLY
jgi:hypothetical protein